MNRDSNSQQLDARARRAAQRVGLVARKSRWRANSIDNLGEFMIIEPRRNFVIVGQRYEYSAEDVIEFCKQYAAA
jgi:hypothetical protein